MKLDSIEMREFAYNLSVSNTETEAINAWFGIENHFEDFKAIVSLTDYSKSLLDENIRNKIDDTNSGFVSYFDTSKLYFISDETMMKMINSGNVDMKIDYSIMFDTNFSSYIDEFVRTGKVNTSLNNVFTTIDMLLRNEYRYDYHFYLIENSKYFYDKDFVIDEQNDIFINIVSLELFKSIDRDVYCKNRKIEYTISQKDAIEQARAIVNPIYNSDDGKEYCNIYRKIHNQILLNIIGIMNINFSSKMGARNKTQKYFEYINDVLGIYMDREAVIAHKYFSKNRDVNIFKRINYNMKPGKLLSVLNNIAWDFTIPRVMEMMISLCGEGDFFVPIFLSFDRDLRGLLNLFPIKGIIFNQKGLMQVMPIPCNSSEEYFEINGCKEFYEVLGENEAKEKRIQVLRKNQNNDYEIIKQEFEKLKLLLCNETI